MKKIIHNLKLVAQALSIALLLNSNNANAVGLNSENFYPAVDNQSGVMWETAKTVPTRSLILGYTFSYALRPVELGDGQSFRTRVNDHLQVNHFAVGYGLLDWLDVGVNLPIALYSVPTNKGGYINNVGSDRNFFFLGDARVRAKMSFSPRRKGDGFFAAGVLSATLPSGSKAAMLSDDTVKLAAELPMHAAFADGDFEAFFTPGAAIYGDNERLTTNDQFGRPISLLQKQNALLLNLGLRYWLLQDGYNGKGLQIEGGIRGDFAEFKPHLNGRASPIEWGGGAAFWLSKALSVHGSYGTGLGSGTTAPLSRLTGGVRYLRQAEEERPREEIKETVVGPSSSAFSDKELDRIFEEAQAEQEPPRLANEETQLRLLTQTEIIDLGAVRFEFNSSRLTEDAKKTVYKLHEQLLRLKPKIVKIDGHTDSVGSFKYNLALSKRRSESVKQELIRLGHDTGIMTTEGFAFKYPTATNATKSGRAQNRRIEVALDGKSFRKTSYTKEETEMFRRWIYPEGRQPRQDQDR